MATKKATAKKPNFEEGLKELESIVTQLEDGALSLEESIAAYERGMKLSKALGGVLDEAEARITKLTAGGDEVDFSVDREVPV